MTRNGSVGGSDFNESDPPGERGEEGGEGQKRGREKGREENRGVGRWRKDKGWGTEGGRESREGEGS